MAPLWHSTSTDFRHRLRNFYLAPAGSWPEEEVQHGRCYGVSKEFELQVRPWQQAALWPQDFGSFADSRKKSGFPSEALLFGTEALDLDLFT